MTTRRRGMSAPKRETRRSNELEAASAGGGGDGEKPERIRVEMPTNEWDSIADDEVGHLHAADSGVLDDHDLRCLPRCRSGDRPGQGEGPCVGADVNACSGGGDVDWAVAREDLANSDLDQSRLEAWAEKM